MSNLENQAEAPETKRSGVAETAALALSLIAATPAAAEDANHKAIEALSPNATYEQEYSVQESINQLVTNLERNTDFVGGVEGVEDPQLFQAAEAAIALATLRELVEYDDTLTGVIQENTTKLEGFMSQLSEEQKAKVEANVSTIKGLRQELEDLNAMLL